MTKKGSQGRICKTNNTQTEIICGNIASVWVSGSLDAAEISPSTETESSEKIPTHYLRMEIDLFKEHTDLKCSPWPMVSLLQGEAK